MLSADEQNWINNRRKIWTILFKLENREINAIQAEKDIRQILYGSS